MNKVLSLNPQIFYNYPKIIEEARNVHHTKLEHQQQKYLPYLDFPEGVRTSKLHAKLHQLDLPFMLKAANILRTMPCPEQLELCRQTKYFQNYTPDLTTTILDIAQILSESDLFKLKSYPLSMPPLRLIDKVLGYRNFVLTRMRRLDHSAQRFAIILPAVSGKTTLAAKYNPLLVDIDTLPTPRERETLQEWISQALSTDKGWEDINAFWKFVVHNRVKKDQVLLCHSPDQLPQGWDYIIINTPAHRYLNPKITGDRRKAAIKNREHLRDKYSKTSRYVWLDAPHKVTKFVTSLLVTSGTTSTIHSELWFYRIRFVQICYLLSHRHAIWHDYESMTNKFCIDYPTYNRIASTEEGITSLPSICWYTPSNLYRASRYKLTFFDVSLGPFSDPYMLYRTFKPAATHFMKKLIRSFCYTVRDLYKITKSIGSLIKKANTAFSPDWPSFVDHYMMLPPLPRPKDETEFHNQMTNWFVEPWPHPSPTPTPFRELYSKAAQQFYSKYEVFPDETITSLSNHFAENAFDYGTTGASHIKAKTNPDGLEYRRTKSTAILQSHPSELKILPFRVAPTQLTVAVKHESGARNRLIVSPPFEQYIQEATVAYPLEQRIKHPETTLFCENEGILQHQRNIGKASRLFLGNPTDLSSCERQQNKGILTETRNSIRKLAIEVFPNAADSNIIMDIIEQNNKFGTVTLRDFTIPYHKGNPSGSRFTQLYNTSYNLTIQHLVSDLLKHFGFEPSFNKIGTGDDAMSFAKDIISIIFSKDLYQAVGANINPKTDFITSGFSEFLRYILSPKEIIGYPTRALRSVLGANPYHNSDKLSPLEELRARSSNWLTLYSRSKACWPYRAMYHDLRNLLLSRGFSLTINEVYTIVHTPTTRYGLGFAPFYTSIDNYTFQSEIHHLRVKVDENIAPIKLDFPSAFQSSLKELRSDLEQDYTPSARTMADLFFDIRKSSAPLPPKKTPFFFTPVDLIPQKEMETVIIDAFQQLHILQISERYRVHSKHNKSPFFKDVVETYYDEFSILSRLFPPQQQDPLFRLWSTLSRQDFISFLTEGFSSSVVKYIGYKAELVSLASQSLGNKILETALINNYKDKHLFKRVSLTVEHTLANFMHERLQEPGTFYWSD
jgi:hypothetical protein